LKYAPPKTKGIVFALIHLFPKGAAF